MEKIRGAKIILNDKPADISNYKPDESSSIYYEVIRVSDGKFLFQDDHLERLKLSCVNAEKSCPESSLLKSRIQLLLDQVNIHDGNMKLTIFRQDGNWQTACFFIPHFYPADEDYSKGVKTKSYSFVRPDPTIKQWNHTFRTDVNQFIRSENIYEAILLNEQEQLTEGSRSNLFFIDKKNNVITAPEAMILPGITRKYILQICKKENIQIIFKALTLREAKEMQGCFITGTSPKVLAVKLLDEQTFLVNNEIITKLKNEYDKMINKQLKA